MYLCLFASFFFYTDFDHSNNERFSLVGIFEMKFIIFGRGCLMYLPARHNAATTDIALTFTDTKKKKLSIYSILCFLALLFFWDTNFGSFLSFGFNMENRERYSYICCPSYDKVVFIFGCMDVPHCNILYGCRYSDPSEFKNCMNAKPIWTLFISIGKSIELLKYFRVSACVYCSSWKFENFGSNTLSALTDCDTVGFFDRFLIVVPHFGSDFRFKI